MVEDLPTCTTMEQCNAHAGERVRVIARYTVWDPLPFRAQNHPPPTQVILMFGPDDEGPFLGAWRQRGHNSLFRSRREIARFGGRRVCVTGRFLRSMPAHADDDPDAASFDGPCIHPVETIEDAG
jgi:hypothetical protein